MNFIDKFLIYTKSRYPLLFINTSETDRAVATIIEAINKFNASIKNLDLPENIKNNGLYVYTWDMICGIINLKDSQQAYSADINLSQDKRTCDIINALDAIYSNKYVAGFYIFKNIDVVLNIRYGGSTKIAYITHILDFYEKFCKENLKWIVFVGDILNIPDEIKHKFQVIDFELPAKSEIIEYIDAIIVDSGMNISKQAKNEIVEACKGLTKKEIEEIISYNIVKNKFKEISIKDIYKEKSNIIKKSNLLEFIEYNEDMKSVGGLDILKQDVKKIAKIYENIENAIKFGISPPKGLLLIGVAGTGKTLASKAIASELKLPLYRANLDMLFGSLVGETERNTRELFKLIKAVSPAVIQIDEIEKALSGTGHLGASDGGVADRLLGSFLTYMQEREDPCFFVATCNDIKSLPAPFVRKGRWDEIFFIDLPNLLERQEIIEIHIKKANRKIQNFDTLYLAKISKNLTGAEIATAIQDALKLAFYENRDITNTDIAKAIQETKGIFELKSEEINYLREWAKDRARLANTENISDIPVSNKKLIN